MVLPLAVGPRITTSRGSPGKSAHAPVDIVPIAGDGNHEDQNGDYDETQVLSPLAGRGLAARIFFGAAGCRTSRHPVILPTTQCLTLLFLCKRDGLQQLRAETSNQRPVTWGKERVVCPKGPGEICPVRPPAARRSPLGGAPLPGTGRMCFAHIHREICRKSG